MKTRITIIALLIAASLQAQIFEPIPYDKKYHIGAGVVAGVWGTFAGNSMDWSAEEAALFGVASATIAGLGKELWDVSDEILFKKEHNFDMMDIAATVEGGIIGAGLSYLALKLFKHKDIKFVGLAERDKLCVGMKLKF